MVAYIQQTIRQIFPQIFARAYIKAEFKVKWYVGSALLSNVSSHKLVTNFKKWWQKYWLHFFSSYYSNTWKLIWSYTHWCTLPRCRSLCSSTYFISLEERLEFFLSCSSFTWKITSSTISAKSPSVPLWTTSHYASFFFVLKACWQQWCSGDRVKEKAWERNVNLYQLHHWSKKKILAGSASEIWETVASFFFSDAL